MIKKDLHIHSSYCDGNDTVEEIIKHAISLEMETVGILAHSYTPFDEEPCIKEEDIPNNISNVLGTNNREIIRKYNYNV